MNQLTIHGSRCVSVDRLRTIDYTTIHCVVDRSSGLAANVSHVSRAMHRHSLLVIGTLDCILIDENSSPHRRCESISSGPGSVWLLPPLAGSSWLVNVRTIRDKREPTNSNRDENEMSGSDPVAPSAHSHTHTLT